MPKNKVLKVQSSDNIIVALQDFKAGNEVVFNGQTFQLLEDIPIKHKFAERDFNTDDIITMYGVTVGKALHPIPKGSRISTQNVKHSANKYEIGKQNLNWQKPDISKFKNRTFKGFHRADGKVGTRNYWLVIPLVFCENRNIQVIKNAMLEKLGYVTDRDFSVDIDSLIQQYKNGVGEREILNNSIIQDGEDLKHNHLFPNVDGIKFLSHDGGCGGIRQDSETLCRLLAGYITHPNVAGATILSLGCQNAQIQLLETAIAEMDANFQKPLYILEQQKSKSERHFIAEAIKKNLCWIDKGE